MALKVEITKAVIRYMCRKHKIDKEICKEKNGSMYKKLYHLLWNCELPLALFYFQKSCPDVKEVSPEFTNIKEREILRNSKRKYLIEMPLAT